MKGNKMEWNFKSGIPIYTQIIDEMTMRIASGYYGPGDKLPSVRDLAMDAGVNPNTVQKAFSELERDGMIFSRVGSGWYVSENVGIAKEVLDSLIRSKTVNYLNDMQALGLDKKEIIEIIKEFRYG